MSITFTYENVKVLRTEITTVCNANCSGCLRKSLDSYFHMSKDLWTSIISDDNLRHVETLYFNGNFGDFICHPESLEFISKIKKKSLNLILSTNGSIRSEDYWINLAKILTEFRDHVVIFAIDGVTQDIHSSHRENTNFDKVFRNAKTFISAGGNAAWQFITFEQNKNQIKDAFTLAKSNNFQNFFLQNSYSPILINSSGKYLNSLSTHEYLSLSKIFGFSKKKISQHHNGIITNCPWTRLQRLQIYADGTVWPCCWLTDSVESIRKLKENHIIPNLKEHSIEEIISLPLYQDFFTKLIDDNHSFCGKSCPAKYNDVRFIYKN